VNQPRASAVTISACELLYIRASTQAGRVIVPLSKGKFCHSIR